MLVYIIDKHKKKIIIVVETFKVNGSRKMIWLFFIP
jgi:hypothetical protein